MDLLIRPGHVFVLIPFILFCAPSFAGSAEVREAVGATWFYGLDLIGTAAFGAAGFIRAVEEDYDLGGMALLTALPAVGGGTLRDLLVGGERTPPFIFVDPVYLYIVFAIVIIGAPIARRWPEVGRTNSVFSELMFFCDTIGLAAFTVIGATVAIVTGQHWFWVPICAAMTCAGGGILLDICTGRPPRVLREDNYEEIAAAGGLLFLGLLHLSSWAAGHFEALQLSQLTVASVVVCLVTVFAMRVGMTRLGWAQPFKPATKVTA